MAGYLFALGLERDSSGRVSEALIQSTLKEIAARCAFGPLVKRPAGIWRAHQEATLADFFTMREGDLVFFICNRRIYGIGRLVNAARSPGFCNFPRACDPTVHAPVASDMFLGDLDDPTREIRWVCLFEPFPCFFAEGVDIDDALTAFPDTLRIIRTFEKRTFVQLPDDEAEALQALLLRRNRESLLPPHVGAHSSGAAAELPRIRNQIREEHHLDYRPVLRAATKHGVLGHEMALEAATLSLLSMHDSSAEAALGRWSYLAHQVPASPLKPSVWLDRMDLFGSRDLPNHSRITDMYMCGELKAGSASEDDVQQLMKYVDWVKDEYAGGDYSMIEGFLVAREFPELVRQVAAESGTRLYTYGRRPARTERWHALRLVQYTLDESDYSIKFSRVSF